MTEPRTHPTRQAAFACDSACHTFSGVAGISTGLAPALASASAIAFMIEVIEPAQPASLQPLTPRALVLAGTGWLAKRKSGACSARGMA